jgi:hypothetical protein
VRERWPSRRRRHLSDEGRARWRSEDLHPACQHHESIDDCIERDGGGTRWARRWVRRRRRRCDARRVGSWQCARRREARAADASRDRGRRSIRRRSSALRQGEYGAKRPEVGHVLLCYHERVSAGGGVQRKERQHLLVLVVLRGLTSRLSRSRGTRSRLRRASPVLRSSTHLTDGCPFAPTPVHERPSNKASNGVADPLRPPVACQRLRPRR